MGKKILNLGGAQLREDFLTLSKWGVVCCFLGEMQHLPST
jgi:hypothetical protein